ncbi:MAG: malto-oligosyltrehalose synthase [Aquabacterium sp.]|nr:MAG: malto-oligosyltrehalose synthase [Aquabacterium sp.]
MDTPTQEPLVQLCEKLGIAPRYHDFWGQLREVPADALRDLLHACGLEVQDPAAVQARLVALQEEEARRVLPPVQVLRAGQAAALPLRSVARLAWTLDCEGGERLEGRAQGSVELPATLPLGYHRLTLREPLEPAAPPLARCSVIVCPARCWEPPALAAGERLWGLSIQLYALRSHRNWGIGDFSDLGRLIEVAGAQGAAFVGLNPLHQLFPHDPERASPYSPSSRNGLDVLYIDVEAVPDFAEDRQAAELVSSPAFQQRLQALRDAELVDYSGVAAAKFEVLELLWAHFRERHLRADTRRGAAFRAFQANGGEELRARALFDALQAHFHARDAGTWGWTLWPPDYRRVDCYAVAEFAREQHDRVEYFEYLQWQAELQLHAAQRRAESWNLPIGLYRDVAVGVNEGGAETWAHPDLYALGLHVGAPPEDYNIAGQDWGLPPPLPQRLRELAYAPFVEMLRANMRHAGALRLDHVMALMRLFWVHPDHGPKAGAYVSYHLDELLGILALESRRHRCMVIGEDLGTVPPQVREAMRSHGVLSYCPLLFERVEGGAFKPPAQWNPHALAVISTHDLPTLRGFWSGADIDLRAGLGLFDEEVRNQQVVGRAQDRAQLLLALEREQLTPEGTNVHPTSVSDITPAFVDAVHGFLARTPSQLLAVQLEDVLHQPLQVNIPGTSEQQYPNWRRKLDTAVEDLAGDARWLSLAAVLRQSRGSPGAARGGAAAAELPALDTALVPQSTYRVQFHAGFRFDDARALLPYLQELGVSHLYASPYLRARTGSNHGYDIVDHDALNPEIGDEEAHETLCAALRSRGMHQLLDIVPNHMGVLQADNAWWLDVLENGPASAHAETFDIEWRPPSPELAGQVLLPVLGDQYGRVLEAGELQLDFDERAGEFWIHYYDHRFPIDPRLYPQVFAAAPPPHALAHAPERLGDWQQVGSLIDAFGRLPARDDADAQARAVRQRDRVVHKQRLAQLVAGTSGLREWITECRRVLNGQAGQPASFDALDRLLRAQAYRLAYWRVAGDDVNYRRFFDINTLAGVRVEREAVFDATHRTIFRWMEEGKLAGLRIDHPDGLRDPQAYFARLQQRHVQMALHAPGAPATPRALYVAVEKILAEHERLPADWPVHGGTGYRYANLVNGLFVDGHNEERFDRLYASFIGRRLVFDEVLHEAKHLIIGLSLAADLQILTEALHRIAQGDRRTCDFTRNRLQAALAEMAAAFPVYRTYITERGVSDADRQHVEWACAAAKRRSHASEISVLDYLRELLLGAPDEPDPARRQAMLAFVGRWQQFTAPVTAKATEDTAFYRYNRLVALNEVGGDPRHFGVSVAAFHAANQHRARFTPHSLLGSSTHDSKRSEDLRARLDVLSELPRAWREAVNRWSELNRRGSARSAAQVLPTRNEEYLLYQTLVGIWPLQPPDAAGLADLRERVQAYMLKAVREAKEHTSWVNPNEDYEAGLAQFVDKLLGQLEPNPFLKDLQAFVAALAPWGCDNSLAMLALKCTAPGVPDVYQGCESWNFSLVDPDNRRPVDYARLRAQLDELKSLCGVGGVLPEDRLRELAAQPADGRIKLYLTWRLLQLRRRHPGLFQSATYHVLPASGPAAAHAVGFGRSHGADWSLTLCGRLLHTLAGGERASLPERWQDTRVSLGAAASQVGDWTDWLSGRRLHVQAGRRGAELRLADALALLPCAVLLPTTLTGSD